MSERLTIYEFLFINRSTGETLNFAHFSSEVTLVRLVAHLDVCDNPLIAQFWPAIKDKVAWIKRTDWAMEGIFQTENFEFRIRPTKDLSQGR